MSTPPDFSRRIPQLDGLRGVAIAMVLAYHYSLDQGTSFTAQLFFHLSSLGWSGVDLFFVLSGFLIGGILLDARESSNYFRVFYARRVCRILPLYFAFLIAVAIGARFSSGIIFDPVIPWSAGVTLTQNFWMAAHHSMASYSMSATWSLAIEEQFYLLVPAVIYFVKPRRLPWILAAGIILAPLIRLAILVLRPELNTAVYVLLPCRMNTLLLGVAAAWFLRQPGAWEFLHRHRRHLWTALEVLTAACALFLIHSDPGDRWVQRFFGFDCFAALYTVLLLAVFVEDRLAKALQAKWLMGLGGIAYCVYLIHRPIFIFALSVTGCGFLSAAIALPLTIAIAKISWNCFEKPFINLGHRANYSGKGEGTVPTAGTRPALEGA